jgi:cation diffusion facilitator CzcD-associated flavoprotein CzcO
MVKKKEETNFGERYTQPDERFSDDFFDVITSFHVNLSEDFTTRIILDPEFEDTFRIDQWWLSFNAGF